MDIIQRLAAFEELRTLKARYFYFLDTKQWSAWLDLFGPNATLKWDSAASANEAERQTSAVFTGRKQIQDVVIAALDPAETIHHGHTPLLEILTPSTARGIWAMEDIVTTADGALHGYGHYHETYEKLDGHWRFASVHLTRLRVITTPLLSVGAGN
jgi:SnoaL-like protein